MIDALVVTGIPPHAGAATEAAARTLATLIEGVVAGMLGRVAIVAPTDDPDLQRLADAAGCAITADLALTARERGGEILALPAGCLLLSGWPARLQDELLRGVAHGEAMAFRPEEAGHADWLGRLFRPGHLPAGGLFRAGDAGRLRQDGNGLLWSGKVRRSAERVPRWRG